MRFVRAFWRFLVGVKDLLALVLLLILFGGLFVGLASGGPKVESGGALVVDLKGSLAEQPADARALDLVDGSGGAQVQQYRLRDVIRAIDLAATDARVKAVVLDLDGFTGGGQAAVSEVGRAVDRVRAAGKPVLARATGYDDPSYQLAAHAGEIWLDPLGAVLTPGPGGSRLYYKGLLNKLGVEAHVYRVGKFKSAVEPFVRTDASPEAKAMDQSLVDALWRSWQAEVARARPKAQVAAYVAALSTGQVPNASFAETARARGLVDRLGDRIDFGRRVAALVGRDKDATPGGYKAIALADWIAANPAPTSGDAIGVVTVAGDIVDGKAPLGTAGGDSIAEALEKSVAHDKLKALVVRIDSPGGSVTGSDRIRTAILAAKARGIPVVVSMGSVAASGGYWVSTVADTVFAEPNTITGSIGVFGIIPTFQNALGKIGLSADGVRATPLSGEPDVLRGTTPAADALIQAGVNQSYARFLALVGAARHKTPAAVDAIGQGRVWDGATAKRIGLVDRFGDLSDAMVEAARRAGLDPKSTYPVYVERQSSIRLRLLRMLTASGSGDADASIARDPLVGLRATPQVDLARALGDARRIVAGPTVQARCLACAADRPPTPGDLRAARALMAQAGF